MLLTDHPHPKLILLSYSSEDHIPSLKEDFVVDLHEPGAQPSEFLTDVVVDRSAAAAVVVCYARKLKVVLLEYGTCSESFDVSYATSFSNKSLLNLIITSVPEQNILSITFLPTPPNTFTLGILHLDSEQRLQLTSRDLDLHEHEISPPPSTYFSNSALSPLSMPIRENPPILIPVHEPELFGGLIVLGGKEIYFFEAQQKKQKSNNWDAESNLAKGKASLTMLPGQQKHSKRRKHKASVMWPWDEISA
jgi:DNA damage-binding protein 1